MRIVRGAEAPERVEHIVDVAKDEQAEEDEGSGARGVAAGLEVLPPQRDPPSMVASAALAPIGEFVVLHQVVPHVELDGEVVDSVHHQRLGDAGPGLAAHAEAPLPAVVREVGINGLPMLRVRAGLGEHRRTDLRPLASSVRELDERRPELRPARHAEVGCAPLLRERVHAVDTPRHAVAENLQLAHQHPTAELLRIEVAFVHGHVVAGVDGPGDEAVVPVQTPPSTAK
mmetsp:Transcript_17835/g.50767  ORF Transcript_17835/g.50767 Transcript_17835/m.50767 type:complete len:229 (-) Transcript_17835:342-1028(-)